jgi:aspartate/methionine/tyrosine aminotransferase
LDVQREYLAQACAAADKAEDEVAELQEQVSLWRTDHGRLYRSNKCEIVWERVLSLCTWRCLTPAPAACMIWVQLKTAQQGQAKAETAASSMAEKVRTCHIMLRPSSVVVSVSTAHSPPLMSHFSPLYVASNQLERVEEIAQKAFAAADKASEEV